VCGSDGGGYGGMDGRSRQVEIRNDDGRPRKTRSFDTPSPPPVLSLPAGRYSRTVAQDSPNQAKGRWAGLIPAGGRGADQIQAGGGYSDGSPVGGRSGREPAGGDGGRIPGREASGSRVPAGRDGKEMVWVQRIRSDMSLWGGGEHGQGRRPVSLPTSPAPAKNKAREHQARGGAALAAVHPGERTPARGEKKTPGDNKTRGGEARCHTPTWDEEQG
jgi:hypothetical protein